MTRLAGWLLAKLRAIRGGGSEQETMDTTEPEDSQSELLRKRRAEAVAARQDTYLIFEEFLKLKFAVFL
jgi:hypothetical protein